MRAPRDETGEQCAILRGRVHQLAVEHWQEAWRVASTIPLPWYRVQALCAVAQHAPPGEVTTLLRTAGQLATTCGDEYKQAAILTWVIHAAIERGCTKDAHHYLSRAIAIAPNITPDRSRAAAMELILPTAMRLGPRETKAVATLILQTAESMGRSPYKRWRKWAKTYRRRTQEWLTPVYPELAATLASFEG
jgi:hypothetical protein